MVLTSLDLLRGWTPDENAPNSQAEKNFGELKNLITGGAEPESVADFGLESFKFGEIRPRQPAVYRGAMCLVLPNGALDFHKRGKITAQLLGDKKNPVDDHHVFPRAYLNKRDVPVNLRRLHPEPDARQPGAWTSIIRLDRPEDRGGTKEAFATRSLDDVTA